MPKGPPEIKISKFLGINDVDPPEMTKPGELQIATNVDITDTHQARRRDGYSSVLPGTPHSLWSNETICLFRERTNLRNLNKSWSASTIRSGLSGSNRMNYLDLNGNIYYTDELVTGVYNGISDRSWGLEVPPKPVLASTVGNLQEGRYICVLTYIRDDGQESGTSESTHIDLSDGGGIIITLPTSSDPTVDYVYIYLTSCNGETFYLAGEVANGTASFTYSGDTTEFSLKCLTLNMFPPPPGQNIQFYNGRILVAQNNILWYSNPYNYELFDLIHGYISFDSRITLIGPVEGGVWVGTQKKIVFLAGKDATEFQYIEKIDCAAIEGTQQKLTDVGKEGNEIVAWILASWDGAVIITANGSFKNITESKYDNPTGIKGASLLREETDRSIFIVGIS
jgi:hypothetical protein